MWGQSALTIYVTVADCISIYQCTVVSSCQICISEGTIVDPDWRSHCGAKCNILPKLSFGT